jgi:transcriptional regulator with XRE-family HTH domain
MIMKDKAILIAKLRSELGLNQAEFAKRLGITRSHLSAVESGLVPVSKMIIRHVETWRDYVELLKICIDILDKETKEHGIVRSNSVCKKLENFICLINPRMDD